MNGEQTLKNAGMVQDLGFAEFTADLIQSTFHAIVAANQSQMQDYQDLLAAVSKTASEYINQTKLEITGEEVLGFLENLPPFLDAKGQELQAQVGSGDTATKGPITFEVGQQVPAAALHQLNKQLNVGEIASGVVDVLGGVKELIEPESNGIWINAGENLYDPVAFEALPTTSQELLFTIVDATENDHIGKLYDAVAKRIALDKYSLLKDMVKLGVLRLVVNSGLIETGLTFESWESEYHSTQIRDHHRDVVDDKVKTRRRSRGGVLGFLRKREQERSKSKHKERHVRVRTLKENHVSQARTAVSIFGRVVVNFSTDYQPVAAA